MPHDALALRAPLPVTAQRRDPRVAILSVAFVVSGFCGLIYESIWSHYLKLFVGHAAYAQTVVLVVFIGGMALGAALVGRVAQRIRAPLLAYAAAEAAVGAISFVFHPAFVGVTNWGYATLLPAACAPESPCLVQWGLAAAMILPQSVLLGTTFPLMTAGILRLAPKNPGGSIALFYFLNSIGAVAGVLTSAFVLIPRLGLPGALLTAGLLNVLVALVAWMCGKGQTATALVPSQDAQAQRDDTASFRRLMLVVAGLTGLSSFVYEIAWIRMLALVIGASTDAFELMLAAFILGLALGGLWVRKRIDRFGDLLTTLAVVQILMGVLAVATLPLYDRTFDLLAWLLQSLNRSPEGYALYNLASHGVALLIMLPATFLAGMTLPLITTALLRGREGERAIGFVYAANTIGAIIGVIIAVHVALPYLGLKGALLLGGAIDVALGAVLFFRGGARARVPVAVAWSGAGAVALLAIALVVPISEQRMASGVYRQGMALLPGNMKVLSHEVGKTANVAMIESAESLSIRTNGKSDAAIALDGQPPTSDEFTMAFTAVLPLSLKPQAEHVAVIGFGSGMTTHTVLGSPRVKRVDTIEIEPRMVEGARMFGTAVERAYTDPRSRIIIDDAKSYFARGALRYDLIISEPSNPWVSGVASLFTVEFYHRVKHQLADDGLFVQWLQAYEFSNVLLGTVLRALDAEFADYAVFAANEGDMMIVASNRKLPRVSDAFTRFPALRPTLERLAMSSVEDIEVRRLAGAQTVRAFVAQTRAGVNSDYYPLVDHGAPRERFLRSSAGALLALPLAQVPMIEMLEGTPLPDPARVLPAKAYHERRDSVQVAKSTAAWLATGSVPADAAPMPRDAGLLRAILWDCVPPPPRVRLHELMFDAAIFVNPHLGPAGAGAVWSAVRAAPCASRLDAVDRRWLDLFEAVGARDAERMARIGGEIALVPGELRADLRRYATTAAAVGHLVTGRPAAADALLDRAATKLPPSAQTDAIAMVLRGYARRGTHNPS
ncbi:MAG TPA: spermidine synthase [Casimicrobiaceae bacterium]|nr:spermidine synthase [Casimicrobiaceae bacterium]